MRLPLMLLLFLAMTVTAYTQLPDCQINDYRTYVKFNGNKLVERTEISLQINSAKGTDYAEIEIPYTKGNSIKELEAGIYDLLGNEIRSLKRKDITHANAFSYDQFHSDDMVLSFELIHNRYPYVLKYSYQEEVNDFLYLAYWVPRRYEKVPVKSASLELELPKGIDAQVYEQGVDSANVQHFSDKDVYKWEVEDASYVERERFGPQYRELQNKVVIIPEHFCYGLDGSSHSWKSFGEWLSRLKAYQGNLSETEKTKVRQLTSNCKSELEKIDVLYKYMQDNTRYINVSLDIGGLQPESAQYVCTNKYGDCKALSNYMQAMLNEVGIPSIYTAVFAGRNPVKVKEAYPSQQFNHVILCVPMANDTIWLECTDNTSPFNHLGTFTQNRKVLLIDDENSKLAITPALKIDDVLNEYNTHVNVAKDGEVTMYSTARLQGYYFDYLKGLDDGLAEREKLDYLEELEMFEQADIQDYEINRLHRDSSYLNLSVDAKLNGIIEPIGSRVLLKPLRPFYIKLDKPEKRTQELRFNYPYNVKDSIAIELPRNIKNVSGIKSIHIESDYGSYKRVISTEENKLSIYRHIIINAGSYQMDDYEKVYQFIKSCSNAELQKGMITYQ